MANKSEETKKVEKEPKKAEKEEKKEILKEEEVKEETPKATDTNTKLDSKKVESFVEKSWKDSVLQTLQDYIKIPNQSTSYDPEIFSNGYQEKALNLLVSWVKKQNVKGLKLEKLEEKNRTPLIFIEIDATDKNDKNTILMYGHFDKQPPLTKDWDKDLGPYKPVIKDGKLYGRGGADDGYAIFGSIDAVRALQDQNLPHSRIVIIIEGSEESGSPDLDYWLDKLKKKIGIPKLVFCLDSGCADYKRLWMTVSLRGILVVTVKASLLKEGIHSGNSGVVRDSFHVLRELLDRIEDVKTAEFKLDEFKGKIPDKHMEYQKQCAKVLGDEVVNAICLKKGCQAQYNCKEKKCIDLLLNSTWKPQISVTGIDGIPDLKGGNVLRKHTTMKLSIRLPPNVNPKKAADAITKVLTEKPPYNTEIEVDASLKAAGFVNTPFEKWLETSMNNASIRYFGKECINFGEGGTIPLMGQLQKQFPKSQFIVTGILGPKSNAHGPNEFLHINYTKKVICCIANILYDTTLDGNK